MDSEKPLKKTEGEPIEENRVLHARGGVAA